MLEELFFALVAVAVMELIAYAFWVPLYYRVGVPLFSRSFRFKGDSCDIDVAALTAQFRGGLWPSIVFRPLTKSRDEIAFRERLLGLSLGHYTPLMHGLIRVEDETRTVSVLGHANLYFVLFLGVLACLAIYPGYGDGTVIGPPRWFALALGAILALIYVIQFRRFAKVHGFLEHVHGERDHP